MQSTSEKTPTLKRLVLCLDGTWNTADGEQITNIVRLRDFVQPIVETENGPHEQRVYYHTGVGTGLSRSDKVLGGGTGAGLSRNVRSAYKFLSHSYRDGVEIYIFGFSRGAFTARSLAGYIGASGLLKPEHCSPENEERAWKFYSTAPDDRYPDEQTALSKLCYQNVRIRLLGVFDTVGALGIPLELFRNWNLRRYQFHDVTLGSNVDYALHALAIDEKRGPFQAALWQYPNHRSFKHVEQVWFPGVHSNVGGGYENRGFSDRTLYWMMRRIEKMGVGLTFLANWQKHLSSDPGGVLYESRSGAYLWSRLRPMLRVINKQRPSLGLARASALPRHAISIAEMVDFTALSRWRATQDAPEPGRYRPLNLEAALDRTFSPENPFPIPIVDKDGDPVDWIKNDQAREELHAILPAKYHDLCEETAKEFKKYEDTSDFTTPFLQPRIPISPR